MFFSPSWTDYVWVTFCRVSIRIYFWLVYIGPFHLVLLDLKLDVKFLTTYLVSATFRLPKKINWAWYKADDLAQYIHTWRYVSNEKPCWLHVSREVLYRKIGQQNQVSLGKFDAGSILNSQYNQSLLYIHMRHVTFRVDIY